MCSSVQKYILTHYYYYTFADGRFVRLARWMYTRTSTRWWWTDDGQNKCTQKRMDDTFLTNDDRENRSDKRTPLLYYYLYDDDIQYRRCLLYCRVRVQSVYVGHRLFFFSYYKNNDKYRLLRRLYVLYVIYLRCWNRPDALGYIKIRMETIYIDNNPTIRMSTSAMYVIRVHV